MLILGPSQCLISGVHFHQSSSSLPRGSPSFPPLAKKDPTFMRTPFLVLFLFLFSFFFFSLFFSFFSFRAVFVECQGYRFPRGFSPVHQVYLFLFSPAFFRSGMGGNPGLRLRCLSFFVLPLHFATSHKTNDSPPSW